MLFANHDQGVVCSRLDTLGAEWVWTESSIAEESEIEDGKVDRDGGRGEIKLKAEATGGSGMTME
jgi:hypothetical protein